VSAYFDSMLRYFEFSGRSSRAQYWIFWFVTAVLCILAVGADYLLLGQLPTREHPGPASAFIGIVHAIPGITVTVRRLHDIDRSGWWYWILALPLVGFIIHLVMVCTPGDEWDNAYGEVPHGNAAMAPLRHRDVPSTIPRQIRMGNDAARPAHVTGGDVQRFI
jgi:uncharacterized membrane protein YhaH (DUF805 family)